MRFPRLLWLVLSQLAACTAYTPQPIDSRAMAAAFRARELDTPELRRFFAAHDRTWPAGAWSRDDLWLVALCCHPDLAAAEAELAIAAARIVTAGQRPNPRLSLAPEFVPNADSGVSPWVLGIGLALPLDLWNTGDAHVAIAKCEQARAELTAGGKLWETRERLLACCFDFESAVDREQLAQRELLLARQGAARSAQRLAVGACGKDEVITADLPVAHAENALTTARAEILKTRGAIAAAIGLPTHAIADLRMTTPFPRPDPTTRSAVELTDIALFARIDLQQQLADYAVSEAQLRLEVAKQYPDFELGPGYQYDQGAHKIQLGLSFELPLFHDNDAAITEAVAARAASAKTFEAMQAQVLGAIESAFADYRSATDQLAAGSRALQTARTGVNRAEQRLAYGEDDASSVTQARLAELQAERDLLAARAAQAAAALQLEQQIGMPLDPLPSTALRATTR